MRDAKIKEEVFVGPQIRGLMQDVTYEEQLSKVNKATWKSLKICITHFWGGGKVCRNAENYRHMVADLVKSHKATGV